MSRKFRPNQCPKCRYESRTTDRKFPPVTKRACEGVSGYSTSHAEFKGETSHPCSDYKPNSPDRFEELARKYIEGSGGLFDFYEHEIAIPLCSPPEVEGARWILKCLTNPHNRPDLDALVEQSNLLTKANNQSLTDKEV